MTTKITAAAIDQKINTFTTNVSTLRNLAQEILVMVMLHAGPKELDAECNGSGDCTRALALAQVMPKSWLAQARLWLGAFTPIRISSDVKSVGYDKKYTVLTPEEKLTWWKISEARQKNFWDMAPEQEPKPFDLRAMRKLIESIPDKIQKQIDKGHVSDEDLATALALKAKVESISVARVVAKPANNSNNAPTPEAVKELLEKNAA